MAEAPEIPILPKETVEFYLAKLNRAVGFGETLVTNPSEEARDELIAVSKTFGITRGSWREIRTLIAERLIQRLANNVDGEETDRAKILIEFKQTLRDIVHHCCNHEQPRAFAEIGSTIAINMETATHRLESPPYPRQELNSQFLEAAEFFCSFIPSQDQSRTRIEAGFNRYKQARDPS